MATLDVWRALHRRLDCMREAGRIETDDLLGLLDIAREVRTLEIIVENASLADRDRTGALAVGGNVVALAASRRVRA